MIMHPVVIYQSGSAQRIKCDSTQNYPENCVIKNHEKRFKLLSEIMLDINCYKIAQQPE